MYCKYCGKELIEEKCDCENAKAELAENEKKRERLDINKWWTLFWEIMKNPINFMENEAEQMDEKSLLTVGAMHLGILFFTVFVRNPFAERFSMALLIVVIVGGIQLTVAFLIYVVNKIFKEECEFINIIAGLCSTTVVLSAGYVAAGVVSLFSWILSALLLVCVFAGWILLVHEVVKIHTKANRNICFWIVILTVGVVSLLLLLVGKISISHLLGLMLKSGLKQLF